MKLSRTLLLLSIVLLGTSCDSGNWSKKEPASVPSQQDQSVLPPQDPPVAQTKDVDISNYFGAHIPSGWSALVNERAVISELPQTPDVHKAVLALSDSVIYLTPAVNEQYGRASSHQVNIYVSQKPIVTAYLQKLGSAKLHEESVGDSTGFIEDRAADTAHGTSARRIYYLAFERGSFKSLIIERVGDASSGFEKDFDDFLSSLRLLDAFGGPGD